ncbi:pP-loop family protein [Firmicutes bacterium CAG:552]|nr:pP-loop family protein [Firmicutes bacterium CAG:552]
MDITAKELALLNKDEYILLDIRDESDWAYGAIPGAYTVKPELIDEQKFQKDKKIIVYCAKGVLSDEIAENLALKGYEAYNLKGGYFQWLKEEMSKVVSDDYLKQVEEGITKRFRVPLLSRFVKAIKDYKLISNGDKIAVCMSGGKDSFLMAKLFQEYHKYSKEKFDLKFVVMDPGYNKQNRNIIEENARRLNIPIEIFESDIFESVYGVEKSPCYLCARMRRGYLYNYAKNVGCNKIALGHHYDDVIETILMGMLYGAQVQTMMPKLKSTNFEGMQLIRPLYLIREDDIKAWRDAYDLHFIQCACKFTDTCTTCRPDGQNRSKRQATKELIRMLKKESPDVEKCIFRSVENVNLDTVIAYKKGGKTHNFLDTYDE